MKTNKPYVKKYDGTKLLNPITKKRPYLHANQSVRDVKQSTKPTKNNKKGIRLIVTNIGKGVFVKYKVIRQFIGSKAIVHFHLCNN